MKTVTTKTKYTLEQLMKLTNIQETYGGNDTKIYKEVANLLFPNPDDIPKKKVDAAIDDFLKSLQEKPDFILRFTHEGIEYGFIPNLDNITTAEYVDLDTYYKEGMYQAHRVMAILYRPIIRTSGKSYEIEKYEGSDKYEKTMLKTDYKIYLSALVFFWNLIRSLLNVSPISSEDKKTLMKKLMTLIQA